MTESAALPRRVTPAELRRVPLDTPPWLKRKLESLGLDQPKIVNGLLNGDLLGFYGLGEGTLRRLYSIYTTVPVGVGADPHVTRTRSGPEGFGQDKVSRKVRLSGELRQWCIVEAERRGVPRAELIRRCVALLHAVLEENSRRARALTVPPAVPEGGPDQVVDVRVLWPRSLWRHVADLIGYIDTNPAGIARTAMQFAKGTRELEALLDLEPQDIKRAFHPRTLDPNYDPF